MSTEEIKIKSIEVAAMIVGGCASAEFVINEAKKIEAYILSGVPVNIKSVSCSVKDVLDTPETIRSMPTFLP